MTVLLAPDVFQVVRPSTAVDSHGFATGQPDQTLGVETGNIQPSQTPQANVDATGRDHGPAEPYVLQTATGYLQPETVTQAGDVLVQDGYRWRVRSVVEVTDPAGGRITCKVAQLAGDVL